MKIPSLAAKKQRNSLFAKKTSFIGSAIAG